MSFMDKVSKMLDVFRRKNYFRPCFLSLACLVGLMATSGVATAQAVGTGVPGNTGAGATKGLQTIAMVNAEKITRNELGQLAMSRYGEDVLKSLIHKHLIMDACQKKGITITTKEVDEEVVRVAKKFNLTPKQWFEMLEKERHISYDQYRNDIIWPTLALRHLAKDKLAVTQEELDKVFEMKWGPKVAVRMISLSSKKEAERIHALAVANPAEFGTFAKDYSEDVGSASARGLIPPICHHMGEPEIEDLAFKMKEGQISKVVHVANQYIILKCERLIPAVALPANFRRAQAAILIDRIRESKMREAAGDVFKGLQAKAQIQTIYENPEMKKTHPGIAAILNGQRVTMQQLIQQSFSRHGAEVLDAEIDRRLLKQALTNRKMVVTDEDLSNEADRMADMYGHITPDGKPDVKAWVKKVTNGGKVPLANYIEDHLWPAAALKKLSTGEVAVDREDLRRAYEANYGEQVEIAVIVLENQRQAMEVWEWARANPSEEYFGKLAQEYSIEPTSKANMGRVPPIRRWTGQKELEVEAFKLQKGDLSGVVVLGDKCIIMKCLGRRQPSAPEMAAVQDALYEDVFDKKQQLAMADAFTIIKARSRIDNYLTGTTHAPEMPKRQMPVRQASATSRHQSAARPVPYNAPR